MPLEVFPEKRKAWKIQRIGDLLDRKVRLPQARLRFHDNHARDHLAARLARRLAHRRAQMGRRDAQLLGVERDAPLMRVMPQHQLAERLADPLGRRLGLAGRTVLEAATAYGAEDEKQLVLDRLPVVEMPADETLERQLQVVPHQRPVVVDKADRRVLAQGVENPHDGLGPRGVLDELARVAQEINLHLVGNGVDLEDAVREDRDHVARPHVIAYQVDRRLDRPPRAISDHHRLQPARVVGIKLQHLRGGQLARDEVLRDIDFRQFVFHVREDKQIFPQSNKKDTKRKKMIAPTL